MIDRLGKDIWHTSRSVPILYEKRGWCSVGICNISSEISATSRRCANLGATESWLLARSLRTLPLRVKKMAENGLALAKFFESHPKVEKVYYPGLESSPSKALADKQFEGNGYGGMLCVNFKGGQKEIDKLISNLQLVRFVPTLAGVGTTLTYPPRASHRDLSPDELAAIGITMGQIRLSSGLEDTDDLLNDFDQALAKM